MSSRWPKDNLDALIAFYGDPAKGQVEANLVKVTPPFRMTYEGTEVKQLVFHKKAADALLAALTTVWEFYGRDQARVDALGISKTAGTYNKRYIAGTTRWSNHAFGAAIDINADDNGFYQGKGNIPPPMIAAFKAQGARWGGDYSGRTDPMHFEFCDSGAPDQSFAAWLAHYGVAAPAASLTPAPPQPASAAPAPAVTDAVRHTMARHILDFEARYNKDHHLEVYLLPANDGGGRYEVAGINEKYDGPEAAKLKAMIEARQFDAAETEAESYILANTNPAMLWTASAGVEFYLRDCVFNRGAGGAAKILQFAAGVSASWSDHKAIDGSIGPVSRKAIALFDARPGDLLTALRAARESYERNVVGYRANFWNGLVNRWNAALVIARSYPQAAPAPIPAPATAKAMSMTTPFPDLMKKLDELKSLLQPQAGASAPPSPAASGTTLVNPAPTGLPQLQGLNLPVEIVTTLETLVNFLPAIAKVVPQLQVAVPFVPLIEGGLNLVEELQGAPSDDPHAIIDVIVKHLQDVVANVQGLKATLQPASPSPAA